MILIIDHKCSQESLNELIADLHSQNLKTHLSVGENTTIIGLIGDTSKIDTDKLESNPHVINMKRVSEPYKRANRKFNEHDAIINVGGNLIGGGHFALIAGPCSVECDEQIAEVARSVKNAGANFLRGGAFKPRTSPYAFQGLEEKGIDMLEHAKRQTGLPVVTEIMDSSDLKYFKNMDMIQVGARNMQNFRLLKELGKTNKPILLKRGLSSTIEELLMSAEYIMSEGNENVILCERGIRTFEKSTRNTLDISAVPVLKRLTHLPVIVDPSHAAGYAYLVPSLAKAAIAAGADGVMIEVHNNPQKAFSDGAQSLNPVEFANLTESLKKYLELENKILG